MIREKRIQSGQLLEAEFYTVLSDGRRLGRAPKTKRSTKEQEAYNKKQQRKKVVRLVNANFGRDDILMTLTFIPSDDAESDRQAKREIANFLRRVKRYRERKVKEWDEMLRARPKSKRINDNLKKAKEPMRYIYAVESGIYQRGQRKGKKRYHFHLFLTGCGEGDRDAYEKLWNGRTNADRYRPETFGPEAAAKYLTKQHRKDDAEPERTQSYVCSRNLRRPAEKVKDGKVSEHKLDLMARKRVSDAAYWERMYKGYKFIRCYARWNDYNAHWYVSVVMYRADGDPPPWSIEDW